MITKITHIINMLDYILQLEALRIKGSVTIINNHNAKHFQIKLSQNLEGWFKNQRHI